MAQAKIEIIPPKPVEPDFTVNLELTKQEAVVYYTASCWW
jgi:hypothetical protein